jgi:hypothetical protein
MTNVTNLSTLERRILEQVDNEDICDTISKEFAKFETEVQYMGYDDDDIGQAQLTSREQERLPLGNQYSEELSVIEWQCVKGAAIYYNVANWIQKVDSSLSYEENISIMSDEGSGQTLRESPSVV